MIEMDTNKFLITTEYEIQFDNQKAEEFEKESLLQGFIQVNWYLSIYNTIKYARNMHEINYKNMLKSMVLRYNHL